MNTVNNLIKFVLIEKDNSEQILSIRGPYGYKESFDILENGYKNLGGELYVPDGNHYWAYEWHYNDYNGTYWSITPIDDKFNYPEYLEID